MREPKMNFYSSVLYNRRAALERAAPTRAEISRCSTKTGAALAAIIGTGDNELGLREC